MAITPAGKAALLVGPESTIFAADRSKIEKIYTMLAYRESADPAYPELSPMEYDEVFRDMGITGKHIKIAIASFLDTNCEMLRRLQESYPELEKHASTQMGIHNLEGVKAIEKCLTKFGHKCYTNITYEYWVFFATDG